MFDMSVDEMPITGLSSTAQCFLDALNASEHFIVKQGKVQLMLFHPLLGKLGGISTKPRGQYILAPVADGLIAGDRLQKLGFRTKLRSNRSPYWYRARHDDFRGFHTALEEITGTAV